MGNQLTQLTNSEFLYLNGEVEVVSGYKSGIIYDFGSEKIYKISKKMAELFNSLIPCKTDLWLSELGKHCNTDKAQTFMRFLIEKGILGHKKPLRTFDIADYKINKYITKCNIELLTRCSFECPHCYLENKKDGAFLDLEKLSEIIRDIAQMGCRELELTGGDIFLRNDIIEICQRAKNSGIENINLLTNGYHLNDNLLTELARLNVRTSLTFYGMSNETYSKFTPLSNAFEIVVENAKKMIKKGMVVNFKYPLMSQTYDEVYRFIEFSESTNGKNYGISGLWPAGKAKDKMNELDIPNDKWRRIEDFTKDQKELYLSKFPSLYSCIPTHLTILSDGNVSFCLLKERGKDYFGNIYQSSIKEIFQRDAFKKWFEGLFITNNSQKCQRCEYKYMCGGDCPLRGFAESKTSDLAVLNAGYPNCNRYKYKYSALSDKG